MDKLSIETLKCISNNPGIYYLKVNELNYIGSSINLKSRLNEHLSSLKRDDHDNPRMQNVFNKYGAEKVWFSILEVDVEISQLLITEKKWIDLLGPVLNNKLDPTTQINSLSNSKKVYQFSMNGQFIAKYASTRDAYRKTKIDSSSIAKCCNGHLKSTGGYLWSYNERASATYDLERSKWKWRSVVMTDEKGIETRFDNIAKAARYISEEGDKFNSLCATISSLCNGKGVSLKSKYKFRYGDSADKIARIAGKDGDIQSAAELIRNDEKVQRLTAESRTDSNADTSTQHSLARVMI